jgi:hypothetical protein
MTGKREKVGWLRYWPGFLFAAVLGYWPRLLFLIPLIAILWVPSYNRLEPTLAGIPFFYWYQLLLILVGAALVMLVYVIETRFRKIPDEGTLEDQRAPGDIL